MRGASPTVELEELVVNDLEYWNEITQVDDIENSQETYNVTSYTAEELAERKQQKYENRVVELLRKKYSLNQELSILRQRDDKPEEYAAYNAYAEECKATAKAEIKI